MTDVDHSVVAIISNSGTVVERYLYDPLGNVQIRTGTWALPASWAVPDENSTNEQDAAFLRGMADGFSHYSWTILFHGESYDRSAGLYDQNGKGYNPATANLSLPNLHVASFSENLNNFIDAHGAQIANTLASVTVGIGVSLIATPGIGFLAGTATFAALNIASRAGTGQSFTDAWVGGWGDALGYGGIFTGLTGNDLGTLDDLHLTTGQRAFIGGMGALQLLTLGITGAPYIARGASILAEAGGMVGDSFAAGGNLSLLSRGARSMLEPAMEWIGQLNLPFRQPLTPAVRASRMFLTATRYVGVGDSPIMGWLLDNIPGLRSLNWEQGHVFIQQRWFRAGSLTEWYPANAVAEFGLQRLGNAGWNLLPMPRFLNSALAQSPWASFAFGASLPVGGVGIVGSSWYGGRIIRSWIDDRR